MFQLRVTRLRKVKYRIVAIQYSKIEVMGFVPSPSMFLFFIYSAYMFVLVFSHMLQMDTYLPTSSFLTAPYRL